MSNRRDGFTLIELLIVVVIIGILAAIAIPKFSSVRRKAFKSAMVSDLRNLATLQEHYHNQDFNYGDDLAALGVVVSEGVHVSVNEFNSGGWAATATHEGIPAEQCGMYNGGVNPANASPANQEGTVTCTF